MRCGVLDEDGRHGVEWLGWGIWERRTLPTLKGGPSNCLKERGLKNAYICISEDE